MALVGVLAEMPPRAQAQAGPVAVAAQGQLQRGLRLLDARFARPGQGQAVRRDTALDGLAVRGGQGHAGGLGPVALLVGRPRAALVGVLLAAREGELEGIHDARLADPVGTGD